MADGTTEHTRIMKTYLKLVCVGLSLWPSFAQALHAVDDRRVERLEAHGEAQSSEELYIKSVWQYGPHLLVITDTKPRGGFWPAIYDPHPVKAFLDLPLPAIQAEYLTDGEFDHSSYAAISAMNLIYSAESGQVNPYEPTPWILSPSLGYLYAEYYPWVYQWDNDLWLYIGEQERDAYIEFLPLGKPGSNPHAPAPVLPSWFTPFVVIDVLQTVVATTYQTYDSVMFRIYDPKRGWLLTDVDYYPYVWSERVDAWLYHRPVSVISATMVPYAP